MKRYSVVALLAIFAVIASFAALGDNQVQIIVAPANGSWEIQTGTDAIFDVTVLADALPAKGSVEYVVEYDVAGKDALTGKVALDKNGKASIDANTLDEPGFVRCKVTYRADENAYAGLGTIACEPQNIMAVTAMPDDFDSYWAATLKNAGTGTPEYTLEYLPDRSTKDVNAYRMWFDAGQYGRFYGMLATPAKEGKYPVVVQYPGAGVYAIDPNIDLARKGVICLSFNIHGIAPDLPAQVYADLAAGPLKTYPTINVDDEYNYYYRRVVAGAVRAVDAVAALPQSDGHIAVQGGSQGGFLAIAVAALNPDVQFVQANFPALSDMAAYTQYATGGWPHHLKNPANRIPQTMHTLALFDTVNFARRIKVPGYYAFGYNDYTCTPRTTQGVYNAITAPKTRDVAPLAGHYLTPEQKKTTVNALLLALRK